MALLFISRGKEKKQGSAPVPPIMKGICKPRRKSQSGSAGLQSPNLINIIFSYLKKT